MFQPNKDDILNLPYILNFFQKSSVRSRELRIRSIVDIVHNGLGLALNPVP
jgi:hypothetical protein